MFLIIILLVTGIFGLLPFTQITQDASAASKWVQTTDTDFDKGTLDNVTIEGTGEVAELRLDLSEINHWTEKKDLNPKPTRRYDPRLAMIVGTDKVLLHGGWGGGLQNDTWVYDVSANNWQEKYPGNSPSTRMYQELASISNNDKVVLFGGWDFSSYRNDTWVYDLSDNTWIEKNPPTYPSARYWHGMASISNGDKVLLFGGRQSYVTLGDLWIYDLSDNSWTQRFPVGAKPSPRYLPALASISGTDKVLLHGGNMSLDDVWVYDLSDNKWTQMAKGPGGLYFHRMASIYGTNYVLLFGGYSSGTYIDETWIFDLSAGPKGGWKQRILDIKPVGRYRQGLGTVYNTDKLVLFGGYSYPGGTRDDTWVYDHNLQTKNGTYISKPYDTGANSSFNTIDCYAEEPPNTTVKAQIRTALNEDGLKLKAFVGPDGTDSTFYSATSTSIWSGHSGDRWIQYIIYFNITQVSKPPKLKDVTITYNCLPNLIVIGPQDDILLSHNKPTFKWSFEDFDSDKQKAFQVLIDDDIAFKSVDFDSGEQNIDEEEWIFPTGTGYSELPDGIWYWKIRVKDIDGIWTEYSPPRSIHVDTKSPSSAPYFPNNNGFYNTIDKISGVANDVEFGSGIENIELSIQRLKDNNYWDGNTWVPFATWLYANGTENWTYDSSSIKWTSGVKYSIQSRATDFAFNIEIPNIKNTFTIDRDTPESIIEKPHDNSWLAKLTTISGSAKDNNGAGVGKVEISVKCSKDYVIFDGGAKVDQFWNGNDWTVEKTWLKTKGTIQWTYDVSNIHLKTGDHYIIESRAIDETGNIESPIQGTTFMFDVKPPENLELFINNDEEYTASTSVSLTLQAIDVGSGIADMSFSTDSAAWSGWETFNTSRTFELPTGDGKKTIYFKLRDYTGNVAEAVFDTIILDSTPPEDLAIIIEDYAEFTNSKRLKLDLQAYDKLSGVDEVTFSYDGVLWLPWEPFIQVRYLNLPDDIPDGEVRVFFKVKDEIGNTAGSIFDSIVLDTKPPHSLSISINNGDFEANSTVVTLNLDAIDDISGVAEICFSNNGQSWTNWETFQFEKSYTLSQINGEKNVYIMVKDYAGNIAQPVADSIILNVTTPEQNNQSIDSESLAGLSLWVIIFIVIIVVMFLIIIGLSMIIKRKKRAEQDLLPPGAVAIKPGGLAGPVIAVSQMGRAMEQPQLPTTTSAMPTPPVPILAKSTHTAQAVPQQQQSQTAAPQALPALPPANITQAQPKIEITSPQVKPPVASSVPKPTVTTGGSPTVSTPSPSPPKATPTVASNAQNQVIPPVSPKPSVSQTESNNAQSTNSLQTPSIISASPTQNTPRVSPKSPNSQQPNSDFKSGGPAVHLPGTTEGQQTKPQAIIDGKSTKVDKATPEQIRERLKLLENKIKRLQN